MTEGNSSGDGSGQNSDKSASPKRGRPGKVDRDSILAAAQKIEPASLTMQDVAASLNVSTPALYHYFRNKDELLAALAQSHLQVMNMPSRGESSWQEWMRVSCLATYDLLAAQPELTKHAQIANPSQNHAVLANHALAVLLDAGFSPVSSRRIYDLMLRFLFRASLHTDSNIQSIAESVPKVLTDHPEKFEALSHVITAGAPDETPRDSVAREIDCLIAGIETTFGPESG